MASGNEKDEVSASGTALENGIPTFQEQMPQDDGPSTAHAAAAPPLTSADVLEASLAALPAAIQEGEEVPVTPDGGVRKCIVMEGSGEKPPLHARCLVHYVGRLASSGAVFMDTRGETEGGEPVCLVAGRDTLLREVGLNLAVATMRQGEKCRLKVSPQYGYGDKGSFSFPSVPPSADLEYELELVGFEPATEEKDRSHMTYEERLEVAERRRLEGNELFKAGNYVDALGKYAMGVSYLNEDFMMQLEGPHLTKAEAVSAPIRLNMAAAQIHLKDYQSAIFNCNQAVGVEKLRAKALFRRGKARALAGQTAEALQDMEDAAKVEPGDRAIAREIKTLKSQMKEERTATDKLFRGQFKPPVARPKTMWERLMDLLRSLLQSVMSRLGMRVPQPS